MPTKRKTLFLSSRFYYSIGALVVLLAMGQFGAFLFHLSLILLAAWLLAVFTDATLLFFQKDGEITGHREIDERFSNGDDNEIRITLQNHYPFPVTLKIIDEVPIQFQYRDFCRHVRLKAGAVEYFTYQLRPVQRGEYHFGALNVFTISPLGLLHRRFRFSADVMAKVYPSFKEMKKFEMMAISNRLTEVGIKKVRRVGHQMEFDQIREYIKGDDYRTINWKATARKGSVMVNQYQEERSQQVISVIDMGRSMKMPFSGMTLLDYAINTSLVLSKIAMLKQDKAGLITFNNEVRSIVPPQRNGKHMQTIMETLYNQTTSFEEHNMRALYTMVRRRIHHRSLIVLYTNFESISAAHHQIALLQKLAQDHLVMVVFFENTELYKLTKERATDIEGIYVKTIAEKFAFDKKLIVKELERYGIFSVLTEPGKLTIETINKYLELKSRGLI